VVGASLVGATFATEFGSPWANSMACLTRVLIIAAAVASPTSARCCPFCAAGASGTNEVKQAVFSNDFAFHLLGIVLPFAVMIGAALLIHGRSPLQGSVDGNPR
jgi:hypothetical protein